MVGSIESFATAEPIRVVHLRHPKFWQRAYTKNHSGFLWCSTVPPTPGASKFRVGVLGLEHQFDMEKITYRGFELYFRKIEPTAEGAQVRWRWGRYACKVEQSFHRH